MQIFEIYNDFINQEAPDESGILHMFSMEEISELGTNKPDKINDAMGFGGSVEIISNIAAFVFLVIAQKIVENGISFCKENILKILLENKEKIIKLLKKRYRNRLNLEEVLEKIIVYLKK